MTEPIEQPLPHSAESERAILGSIVLDGAVMNQAASLLTPEDFYVASHRRIYRAMLALFDENEPVEALQVAQSLVKDSALESVGGLTFITGLAYGLPRFTNIAQYAKHIRDAARRRYLIKLGNEIVSRGLEPEETESQIADWIDTCITQFRLRDEVTRKGAQSIGELIEPQLERFERFHKRVMDSVPTGFREIDTRLTGSGLGRSMLHYLAARPSMGKTALALDISFNAANAGYGVYFATLEMSKEVLLDRAFAVTSGVERWKLSPGLSDRDLERLREAAPSFRPLTIEIDDFSRSVASISRAVRDMQRRHKVDLIVVDYLQLMDTQKSGSRNDQVGANSRGLQSLAKESGAAVLCLSQLNRECDTHNREPELRDLRDSGEIEQDARTVMLLFGDKAENEGGVSPEFRDITLKCAKQGEGALFRSALPFNTKLVTFRSFGHIASRPTELDPSWTGEYNF